MSARLCLGAPCRVDDADFACKLRGFRSLSQFSWLVVSSLRRRVGKQTPAAPELQLRDVVWSDESLFQLRQEPNRQITRICWVTVDLSFSQLSCLILLRSDSLVHLPCRDFHGSPCFSWYFPVGFSMFLVHPRVCHRTWTGSRRTFEHVAGSAGQRLAPPKAGFSSGTDTADRIVPLKDTAQKHVFLARHLTLHGTLHRHRQHLPFPKWAPLILEWAPGPRFSFAKTLRWAPGLRYFCERLRKW